MAEEKFSPENGGQDEHDESNPSVIQAASAGQKRSQDGSGGPASKKAHIDSDDSVQVKVLIPSAAVGAIIGKGGETMRALKHETNCKVQMSKNQEMYQNTNERICMVKGRISAVMCVMAAISEKIREKVDTNAASDQFDHKGVSRTKEMKLLMPNTSAGMVIGKSGASIKDIREGTGCQIQVFPKAGSPEAKNSLERVVTVAHDDVALLMAAVQKVLEKVAADPQHANPVDNKDTDNFHQVFGTSGGGGGGGFDNSFSSQRQSFGGHGSAGFGGQSGPWANQGSSAPSINNYGRSSGGGGQTTFNGNTGFKYNPMQGVGNNELLTFLDSLQATLRTSGFNEASVAEVMQAMQVLAKYNIMGLGLGLGVAAMAQMRQGGDANPGQGGFEQQGYAQPQQEQHRLPPGSNAQSGGFAATVLKEKSYAEGVLELEVPDTIVGAVLGPKAKTLAEIQQCCGCKVEVHKRQTKETPAGTRLISLTGDEDTVKLGRDMIERVINEEQARRSGGNGQRYG